MGKGEEIMKKIHLLVMLLVIGLVLASQVNADMLVVDIDPTDSDTNPQWLHPSNPATEEAWLEGLLGGTNVFYFGKDEDNTWNDGVWTEGNSSLDWTYAVLIYGVGKLAIENPDHWAILDADPNNNMVDFGDITGLPPLDSLSHISYFGAAPVPEPATMLLFGTGLAGLGVFRRKFKKA